MKKLLLILIFLFSASSANAAFTIFACEMEWAGLARDIVGNKAIVVSAAMPFQDISQVKIDNKITKDLRTADMVFCSGGGLDETWLQNALNASDNPVIAGDQDRLLFAYNYAKVRTAISSTYKNSSKKVFLRTHLNPYNILFIAKEFTRRVSTLNEVNAEFYKKSYEKYAARWEQLIATWEANAVPLKKSKAIIYDDSWVALINWLGITVVDKVELSGDKAQDQKRMEELLANIEQFPVDFIIVGANEDRNFAFKLGQKSKTNVVLLPFTVGGTANSGTLEQLFNSSIYLLLANCPKSSCFSSEDQSSSY